MPRKPRLLLGDAVAIIAAHQLGVWQQLCVAYDVVLPSIVVEEAHFYKDAGESAQSLASALRAVGITKQLPRHHTDDFVAEHRRLGSIRMIEGRARIAE